MVLQSFTELIATGPKYSTLSRIQVISSLVVPLWKQSQVNELLLSLQAAQIFDSTICGFASGNNIL